MEQSDLKSLVHSERIVETEEIRNVIEDIEITPPVMVFKDAYEGKEFTKTLTLRNIGCRLSCVRIGAPTANSFRMTPMKRSCRLPPGLCLSRMIKMKYCTAFAVHDAQIPIQVNNSIVYYPLTIYLNQAKIIVEPTEVNFGRIDAVSSVVSKTVTVRNIGTKNTTFCIDLGRNELELIVEPTKGILQASESVTFKLEVMGFYEGPFEKEFWIKTAPPKRVTVFGEFITPRIISTYPKAYADFSMVIFSRLYVGQSATKALMVKNMSSCNAMFCIEGICKKKYVLYEEAAEANEHYKSFRMNPLEGRIGAQQTAVIEITFEPITTVDHHAVCFIQVVRVECTDVNETVVIRGRDSFDSTSLAQERSRTSLMTISSPTPQAPQEDEEDAENARIEFLVTEEKMQLNESFRVCLYGDKENANVKLKPEVINLNQIQINDLHQREIWIENCSSHLPINVVYIKIAYIDVLPSKIFLKPQEKREVLLKVNAKKMGHYCKKVCFNLVVYENYNITPKQQEVIVGNIQMKVSFTGVSYTTTPKTKFVSKITPDNLNEVGFMTHDMKFNSKVPKMKGAVICEDEEVFKDYDSDLIAFPNDRAQSLRPWRETKPIKTIFAKIPRNIVTHDEYSYPPEVLTFKKNNADYYLKYLRQKLEKADGKMPKQSQDHNATRSWMLKQFECEMTKAETPKVPMTEFGPLSVIFLNNIKIRPRYIRLQRVAPISNVEHQFTIFNDNPFPIFIYVTSVKTGIYFHQGNCKIVKEHELKVMTLTCFAGLVGRYINLIQVIVNFCHLYTISVMVEVVPKMINLNENVLNFEPEKSGNIKFIPLQNYLNSPISFFTEMSPSRFSINPKSGTILQKRTLLCSVEYNNVPEVPDYCELVLTSEGGGSQILQISRKKVKPSVEIFPSRLILPNLPLNLKTVHKVRLVNGMNYPLCYYVADPSPTPGIDISPYEGVIESFADLEVEVEITINNTENFETRFEFVLEDQYSFYVHINGHVVIPSIDIKPENIVNRQLFPFAYRRNIFYVKNESTCECVVRFDLDQYEYFRVTEKEEEMDSTIHNTNLKILPGEVKQLFLHFEPMDALTESFYMPVIVNDMVGPPYMSNLESLHFKLEGQESGTEVKLPCLKVTSICSVVSLHFSTLKLSFTHALSYSTTDHLTKFFTVKNLGSDQMDFCIRIDKIKPQFSIEYHSGVEVEETRFSLNCSLQPTESSIFVVKFIASSPGIFISKLPIYVRNYLDGCIFNYLRLIGVYETPQITTDNATYYLGCTPVGFKSAVMLDLRMQYHNSSCQVSFDRPPEDITISHRERASRKKSTSKFKILYLPTLPGGVFEDINFMCSCGGSCSIKLVCYCEDTFLNHYAFFLNNRNFFRENLVPPAKNFEFQNSGVRMGSLRESESVNFGKYLELTDFPENENKYDFPFFPLEIDEENDYEYHYTLRNNLKYVEKWIFSQGFFKKHYYHIPYTIALAPIVRPKEFKKDMIIEPPILTFLVELAGEQVREASIRSKVAELNDKNMALHFMITYSNLLKFLCAEGAIIPHILPEFLLTYEYYQIIYDYCPNLLSMKGYFGKERFHQYSTRCFLDLILQGIKLYILRRVKMFDIELQPPSTEDVRSEERLSAISTTIPVSYHVMMIKPNINVYTSYEQILLYWLQYHYDTHKNRLWKSDELSQLPHKEIKIFDELLNDSLVFACVTIAYCPYLSHALADMYVPPATSEEYHHNACTIIKAWNLLNLSFIVEPDDIVNPNAINMLLLTLYLYEILPSYFPKHVLTLQAKLTKESKANINLTNSSDHFIMYSVTFFNNESGSFQAEFDVFKLPPKNTNSMMIKYHAKKISSQKAVLVLSGELPGQKYGRSKAVLLNGETDLNYAVKKIEMTCECYKIEKMKIKLHSPYNVPDTYEILFATTDDDFPNTEENRLFSWKEYINGKVPRRIFSKEWVFTITDPEEGFFFEPIVCCEMLSVKTYKMFMVGQHGDWCFEIKCKPKMSKDSHETINVSLPRGFKSQTCSCRDKTSEIPLICPRTIHINIPAWNALFLKSIREMFIACTEEQYLAFWRKYLPTRTVLNILKLLYVSAELYTGNNAELKDFFSKPRTFNIFTEANAPFTAQKKIFIDDTSADKNVEILLHANPDFSLDRGSYYLEMETDNRRWKRFYKLNFYES